MTGSGRLSLVEASLSTDTSLAAERVQIALLRQASEARRSGLCRSLSRTVVELSRRALREAMPDASEREVLLRWVGLNYGEALAEGLRRRLLRAP
jgi:hypothetical protein